MKTGASAAALAFLVALGGCGGRGSSASGPARAPGQPQGTLYGFFPNPPEITRQSVRETWRDLGRHGEVVLLQQNVPWERFAEDERARRRVLGELRRQFRLARRSGLEVFFVVDPLNGLNRAEFFGLPAGWQASFADPRVRATYSAFCLRAWEELRPRCLGLASEINTYTDAHPEEIRHFLSLYREVYERIKARSPETRVFVTFQWEDLNNLISGAAEGRPAYRTNWEAVEAFEPRLDVWAISSYPWVAFGGAAQIPANYYTPLLARTAKPLAVAEGGYPSMPVGPVSGSEQDQLAYLRAIRSQLGGPRLAFWIYLLLGDLDLGSYAPVMRRQGASEKDIQTLGFFAQVGLRRRDGTPKPALVLWDSFRE